MDSPKPTIIQALTRFLKFGVFGLAKAEFLTLAPVIKGILQSVLLKV